MSRPLLLLLALTAGSTAVASSSPPAAARPAIADLRPEVERLLGEAPWESVADREQIQGPRAWRGEADLSFRYRKAVSDGALALHVEVTDDRVRLGRVSDRIELFLADGAFHWPDVEEHAPDGRRYSIRIRFDGASVVSAPERPALSLVRAVCLPKQKGYELLAIVPLGRLFDLAGPELSRLGFLLDVHDVDQGRKGALIASTTEEKANHGRWGTLDSFEIGPPLAMPVPAKAALWCRMAGAEGILLLGPEGYACNRMPSEVEWQGESRADYRLEPLPFEPMAPANLSRSEGIEIYAHESTLGLLHGEASRFIDLGSDLLGSVFAWEPIAQTLKEGALYLLFSTVAHSRGEPGPGECGSGEERALVWLAIDAQTLELRSKNASRVYSCLTNRDSTGLVVGDPLVTFRYTVYAEEEESHQVTFDRRHPEKGLVDERLRSGQPKE